jgi:hypothetical protein
MVTVKVEGRQLVAPVTAVITTAEGVSLRIDDERRPEFWLSVFIPADTLALVAQLVADGTEHHEEAQS